MKPTEYSNEVRALALFLEVAHDSITETNSDHYGLKLFEVDGAEYAVGTDSEADNACEQSVEDSLWTFNAKFLVSQCELPHQIAPAIRAWQEKDCEDANDGLSALVNKLVGIPDFTQAAISADGRGHFLSQYDGKEYERTIDGETYYIYRTN